MHSRTIELRIFFVAEWIYIYELQIYDIHESKPIVLTVNWNLFTIFHEFGQWSSEQNDY